MLFIQYNVIIFETIFYVVRATLFVSSCAIISVAIKPFFVNKLKFYEMTPLVPTAGQLAILTVSTLMTKTLFSFLIVSLSNTEILQIYLVTFVALTVYNFIKKIMANLAFHN